MIHSTGKTLEIIKSAIEEYGNVYFTRYGDGDIIQMSGTDLNGQPIHGISFGNNKTIHTPQLEKDLITAFKITAPNYLKGVSLNWENEPGMAKGLFESFNEKKTLYNKISKFTTEKDFLNPIVFHYLITFLPEVFDKFCEDYIKPIKKLYVGCVPAKNLECIFGNVDYHILTVPENAVAQTKWIWEETKRVVEKYKPDLVIPSCGQTSRVITGKLWNNGYNGSVIDFGSLVDVFEDRPSRTWIRMKGAEIKARYGKGN